MHKGISKKKEKRKKRKKKKKKEKKEKKTKQMAREKLNYKKWKNLNIVKRNAAKKRLVKGQQPEGCEYGYNSKGELVSVLDYMVLADIFRA